jgi:small-conductance mechanosensitive channel
MQFAVVRTVGVSLLASAGVAGVVLGLAAQKSIGALLAGIQLSITQPIRIGDQVVFESENGTVEEISLTYVVVRTWDFRRLVVPVTQFLEKAFQNWSKGGVEMLGTVTLQVDWATDIEAIRKELARVLATEAKDLWDGKTAKVHVVDSTEQTMQLRILLGGFVDSLSTSAASFASAHRLRPPDAGVASRQRMEHMETPRSAAPSPRRRPDLPGSASSAQGGGSPPAPRAELTHPGGRGSVARCIPSNGGDGRVPVAGPGRE